MDGESRFLIHPNGGNYDGKHGSITALEIIEVLNEHNIGIGWQPGHGGKPKERRIYKKAPVAETLKNVSGH